MFCLKKFIQVLYTSTPFRICVWAKETKLLLVSIQYQTISIWRPAFSSYSFCYLPYDVNLVNLFMFQLEINCFDKTTEVEFDFDDNHMKNFPMTINSKMSIV
jgi:hypothetical protein